MTCVIDKPDFALLPEEYAYVVIARGRLMVVTQDGALPTVAQCRDAGIPLDGAILAAHADGEAYWGIPWWAEVLPAGFTQVPVRGMLHTSTAGGNIAITRAIELVSWRHDHQFCGRCGQRMQLNPSDGALQCPACKFECFPVICPAMIVRITRNNGREILLARNRGFFRPVFSNISGFVESGEKFEDCVEREVMEEVGIRVRNIRYFGSQNWPFPHSLLAAFTAEYAGGELHPDGEEIVEAKWFARDGQLPPLPELGSISRAMIDDYLGQ
jgi:NAD+ diphosphatase